MKWKLKPCKWTTWYNCLVCRRCFESPDAFLVHKNESDCSPKYPTLKERGICISKTRNRTDKVGTADEESPVIFPTSFQQRKKTSIPAAHSSFLNGQEDESQTSSRLNDKAMNLCCYFCSTKLGSQFELRNHMKQHTMEREVPCIRSVVPIHDDRIRHPSRISKKGFNKQDDAKPHGRIKTVNCYCKICKKSFHGQIGLLIHMLIHDAIQPYCCNICKKEFSAAGNLKKHLRIHDGIKPYSCKICKKRFNQKGNRNTHMRIHDSI